MRIRQEEPRDYEAVYRVVQRAFERAAHSDGTEQDLITALRNSVAFVPALSLIAETDGEIVGYILFTEATVGDAVVLALAPLAVLPEYQGRGIGTALIRAGHRIAAELGYGYSVVLGSETYYPKAGYLPAKQYGIELPFDLPSDNYMACKLTEDTPLIHGTMTYAKEFEIG